MFLFLWHGLDVKLSQWHDGMELYQALSICSSCSGRYDESGWFFNVVSLLSLQVNVIATVLSCLHGG